MATQTVAESKSGAQPSRIRFQQLPMRKMGFKYVPAFPVDIPGMVDTLLKLGIKTKQYEQAIQGLSKTFTIGGSTACAYNFLYGDEEADAKRGTARERLRDFLRRNPLAIHHSEAAEKIEEQDEELAQDHDLTTLSLDDPKQW